MNNSEVITELYKAIANIQKAINELREIINNPNETKEDKPKVRI